MARVDQLNASWQEEASAAPGYPEVIAALEGHGVRFAWVDNFGGQNAGPVFEELDGRRVTHTDDLEFRALLGDEVLARGRLLGAASARGVAQSVIGAAARKLAERGKPIPFH